MPSLRIRIKLVFYIGFLLMLSGGQGTLRLILVVTALSIHEAAHWIVSRLFGYRVLDFRLTLCGGTMSMDAVFASDPLTESCIAAAGPMINFLMAGLILVGEMTGSMPPLISEWKDLHLYLGLLNLLPAAPLDGGRILHAFLNQRCGMGPAERYTRNAAKWTGGLLVMAGLFCCGLFPAKLLILIPPAGTGFSFYWQNGFYLITAGCFILALAPAYQRPDLAFAWRLYQHKKKRCLDKGFINVYPVAVRPETPLRAPLQHYGTRNLLCFFIPGPDGKWHAVSEDSVWNALLLYGYDTVFGDLTGRESNFEEIKSFFQPNPPSHES